MATLAPSRPVILPQKQIDLIVSGRCTRLLLPRDGGPAHIPPYSAGAHVVVQAAASEPARLRLTMGRVTEVELGGDELLQETPLLGYRDIYELQADWLERVGPWRSTDHAWLYRIAVDASAAPRLLHRDSSRGYTPQPFQALRAAGEAPDEFADAASVRAAHAAEVERFARERAARAQLAPHERLRLITEDAQRRDVALTPEINAVLSRIAELERRILVPVDRTLDVVAQAPAAPPSTRRHKRSEFEKAAAKRRQPGELVVRHVDPSAVREPGTRPPRASAI